MPAKTRNCAFETLEVRRLLSAGDLDPYFGDGGTLRSAELGFVPHDAATQADGKLVVVGRLNDDFAVARLNADASLDRSFGGDGIVTTNFGGSLFDSANAVAIQNDGKVVVVGVKAASFSDTFGHDEFAIARYRSDGSLDRTFGGDGKVVFGFNGGIINDGDDSARDVAIMDDGRIVVVGQTWDPGFTDSDYDFAVARLNPNGKLDRTFGNPDGRFRTGKTTIGLGRNEDATAVALQPDGKILIGGISEGDNFDNGRFALVRLRTNGTRDRSFSGDGKLTTDLASDAHLSSLAIQTNGRIVAAGSVNGAFALTRYLPDGRLDASFGTAGRVLTDLAPGDDRASTVLVTPDNKIIAGGTAAGVGLGQFALARYNLNGSLDTTFGNGGKGLTGFGGKEAILDMNVTADGKLTVSGFSGERAALARYLHFVPDVNIFRLTSTLVEGDGKEASFLITRDKREDFTTRVYYTIGGSATAGADYTIDPAPNQRYVDIKPNETFSMVKIKALADAEVEPTQTVTLQLLGKKHYELGSRSMASIKIRDTDVLRVNFQPDSAPVPAGYQPDTGLIFGDRGNGYRYGWDADNSAQTRDRELLSDQRFDTLTHLQKDGADRVWQLAVANGSYRVRVASSDPAHDDGHWRINAEDVLALDHVPAQQGLTADNSVVVNVTDNRLTIRSAAGAINSKLAFLEIRSSEFVAPPRPTAPPGGVVAPTAGSSSSGSSGNSGGSSNSPGSGPVAPIRTLVFSQQRIDPDDVLP